MLIFRADGNKILGTGHIMRCLSIADAVKARGSECVFVTADNSLSDVIKARGYENVILGTDFQNMEAELPALENVLSEKKPVGVVVDSYYVTARYLTELGTHVPVTYIDDLASFAYPVDRLINYNVYADEDYYISLYKKAEVRIPQFCMKPSFAPLRAGFKGIGAFEIKEKVENVLVLTGGADPLHVALNFAHEVSEHPVGSLKYNIVVGGLSQDVVALQTISESRSDIELFQNVSDMKSLMLSNDLAVSAAGSTQYELCACGVPTINYVFADNQIPGMEGFSKAGIMISTGDVRTDKNIFVKLYDSINELAENAELRKELSLKAQHLVDGRGAERIAEILAC